MAKAVIVLIAAAIIAALVMWATYGFEWS